MGVGYDDALTEEPPVRPKPPLRTPLGLVATADLLALPDDDPPIPGMKTTPPVRTCERLPPAQFGSGVPSGRGAHGRLAFAC